MDVNSDINYFPPMEGPIETSAWKPRYHGVRDESTLNVTIRDARGIEGCFDLDVNGFKFVQLSSNHYSTDNDKAIQSGYYAEVGEILKRLTGASKVHIFNHTVRRCSDPFAKGQLDAFGRWQVPPSGHPHVDYSGRPQDLDGTLQELKLPVDIHRLFNSAPRFAFINAWRPLANVRRDPLAVADAASVPDGDYIIREREFRQSGVRSGNYVLSHPEGPQRHVWYWMSEMRPDEMVVFKQLDSMRGKPGWRCPHTAFVLPGTQHLPARESIEVRAVCFWE